MNLALKPRPRPSIQREFRYTRELYHTLDETGVFDGAKVELIRGRLIEMPAIGTDHGSSSLRSARVFRHLFPEDRFTVRPGLPFISADESEPEPDLCVVDGSTDVTRSHPSSCLLLIEIADATLSYDRKVKAPLYAESGVADYWIINLMDRVIEIYRNPARRDDGTWSYDPSLIRRLGEACVPLARPAVAIAVVDLLPVP